MKTEEIKVKVITSIQESKSAKVYFKLPTRSPMYGRFASCEDHEDLLKKNWIRFVPQHFEDQFEATKNSLYTKLFDINTFTDIKLF